MIFKNFQEYLDNKNKLVTTGVEKVVADYDGPVPTKPATPEGGKEQNPYLPANAAKKPDTPEDGFANTGDKSLVYEPDTKVPSTPNFGTVVNNDWTKTKTQEWLDRTKGMSLAEFTKTIHKQVSKIKECKVTDRSQAIKYVAECCKGNATTRAALIREMKKSGSFKALIKDLFENSDVYPILAKLMVNEEVCQRLANAINEEVAPPAHKELMKKMSMPTPDEIPDNISGEEMPPEDSDDPDAEEELGDEEMGDEDELDAEDGSTLDDEPSEDMEFDADDEEEEDKPSKLPSFLSHIKNMESPNRAGMAGF